MSKELSKTEIEQLIENAKQSISSLFSDFLNKSVKKASLLAYWIVDYVKYLKAEDQFSPERLIRYHSGDIVQVHLGYRLGSELGGLHYAIVLDNRNQKKSSLITILPLRSLKGEYKDKKYTYLMKSGVYDLCVEKSNALMCDFQNSLKDFQQKIAENNEGLSQDEISCLAENFLAAQHENVVKINNTKKALEKLKSGTIVDLGQITTVSKMRISNPKMVTDSLSQIRATQEDMKNIYEKLKVLYF